MEQRIENIAVDVSFDDMPNRRKRIKLEQRIEENVREKLSTDQRIEKGLHQKKSSIDLFQRIDHSRSIQDEISEQLKEDESCNVVNIVITKSIRLYIMCNGLTSLHKLRRFFDSGVLKICIEELFNECLSQDNVGPIKVKIVSLVDYCKCEDYLVHGKVYVLL